MHSMKAVEFCRWHVRSDTPPFKGSPSVYRMTEAVARSRHPEAVSVEGTMEIRHLDESDDERADSGRRPDWNRAV